MNIEIEFIGFSLIYDLFPEGRHPYTFPGSTLLELVESLFKDYGKRVRESLQDAKTKELDPTVQIKINRKFIKKEDFQKQSIEEGDQITFLKLLAGG